MLILKLRQDFELINFKIFQKIMNIIYKIIITLLFFYLPLNANAWWIITISPGNTNSNNNITISTENTWTDRQNSLLKDLNSKNDFFWISTLWEKWIKNLILNLARDLKILLYTIILLLWIIVVMKLIFSKWWEDDIKKLKNWIIYLTIWIILIQSSSVFWKVLFDKSVNVSLANDFSEKLLQPIINLFYTLAAFVFIFVAIVAFYKIVFAWWNDDWIKKWKQTIIQALIWFIVIKFAKILVDNTYRPDCDNWKIIKVAWTTVCENITQNAQIIMIILNWINWFLWIVIILMIIYAWFLYITSWWKEDNQKKAKNIIVYIAIWLLILVSSYLILTFFIYPN